ncbi:MAG: hypothetical protein ACPG7F_20405, partial [Aggregatilineales bacterium]
DLTGEGQPEILIGYTAPGDIGTLLIIGCANGEYLPQLQLNTDDATPPEIIRLEDINQDEMTDLVISGQTCVDESCDLETQIITWDARRGQFVGLLEEAVYSQNIPELRDVDEDTVLELVVRLQSRGTAATGPLRTGLNIYDWNGSVYTLSIRQPDPPRYHIQVVHEGDRAFSRQEFDRAAEIYEVALSDDALRYWFNDGEETVDSYVLYRLILAYTQTGNARLSDIIVGLDTQFGVIRELPPEEQPIYAAMAYTYLNAFQQTGDVHLACDSVRELIEDRPDALELMNRYGSRSPTYEALDLCPY